MCPWAYSVSYTSISIVMAYRALEQLKVIGLLNMIKGYYGALSVIQA